jgi:phage-related protein
LTNIYLYVYLYDGWEVENRAVVGSTQKDLRSFPAVVRLDIGYALYAAQKGETDPAAKPLKGFGGCAVMEIVAPFDGNIWRAVYTV